MRKNNTPLPAVTAGGAHSCPANPVRRILVVDDDPFFRHRNAEVLIRHGYDVNAAEDGGAGWEELQANQYHLVITESELPSMPGIELVRKLRSARLAVPVIVASEKLPAAQAARHIHIHLHPMLTLLKPYTIEEFLDAVRVVLGATQIEAEEPIPQNRPSRQPVIGLRL
jgi:DNA-binding response OmpR family regulator